MKDLPINFPENSFSFGSTATDHVMSCIDDVGKPWSLRVITMSEDKLEALVRLYARTVIGLQTLEK